ncbi:MAG: triose-phosphate isomerase [Candidatus Omnitrophica bacterium]|nr:triose-phosphate isomerase [Candidatus Omnitrophota bacterium]
MRKKFICGNWKMNKTTQEACQFASEIRGMEKKFEGVEVGICPPYTALQAVHGVLDGGSILLGAQDVAWAQDGAYTGEVSPLMLKEVGCTFALVGHSERRTLLDESDELINRKLLSALQFNMTPLLCVGESLDERERGMTERVVETQLRGCLAGTDAKALSRMVIAYEPVWAIGTGRNATPHEAQEVHAFVRRFLAGRFEAEASQDAQILYGGSVTPKNAAALLAQPDIDGALVGGASLDVRSFTDIIQAAREIAQAV